MREVCVSQIIYGVQLFNSLFIGGRTKEEGARKKKKWHPAYLS